MTLWRRIRKHSPVTGFLSGLLPATKHDIHKLLMNASQLEERINAANARLTKALDEITNEIATLKESLKNVEVPYSAVESLARLDAIAEDLDNLNPDTATVPGEDVPTPGEVPSTTPDGSVSTPGEAPTSDPAPDGQGVPGEVPGPTPAS